jgi:Predicted P-loop ATPase fused to an acetyltransferase
VYEQELGALLGAAQARNHRATVICDPALFNSVSWALESYSHGYYACLKSPQRNPPSNSSVVSFSSYGRVLGETVDYVVYEAIGFYDPNALAALADTVRGGGTLFLVVDKGRPPVYHQFDLSESISVLIPRFIRKIESSDLYAAVGSREIRVSAAFKVVSPRTIGVFKSFDQREAYDAVLRWFTAGGDVFALLSRRGRGKSALLGMVLRELCLSGKVEGEVYVTSHHPTHVTTLLKHLAPASGFDAALEWGKVVELGGASVVFESPKRVPSSSIVFVDEASTLPFGVLVNLITKATRVVLSTTNYGYEGSGKSFQTRLLNWITSSGRSLEVKELFEPVRYSAGDPLEEALTNTFLFFAHTPRSDAMGTDISDLSKPCNIMRLGATDMAQMDESKVAEVYSILTEAHYRNEPRDLSIILENLKSTTFVYTLGSEVVGVATCVREGPISHGMVEAVLRGASFPGNLITERLVARSLSAEFAQLVGQRVVRIAVKPPYQGRGHGSNLLKGLEANFKDECDWIGASFSADYRTVVFWFKNGYIFPAVSWSSNRHTQHPSVLCVKPLSDRAKRAMRSSVDTLRAHISSQLHRASADARVYAVIVKSMSDGERQMKLSVGLINFAEWSLPVELIIPDLAQNLFSLAHKFTLPEVESMIRLIQWRSSASDSLRVKAALKRILHGPT